MPFKYTNGQKAAAGERTLFVEELPDGTEKLYFKTSFKRVDPVTQEIVYNNREVVYVPPVVVPTNVPPQGGVMKLGYKV